MTNQHVFLIALTMMMSGIILLGLLRREKTGFANIGFESVLVLLLYLGAIAVLAFAESGTEGPGPTRDRTAQGVVMETSAYSDIRLPSL